LITGRLAGLLFVFAVLVIALVGLWLFQPAPPEDRQRLEPVTFASLKGWDADALDQALSAFQVSCRRTLTFPPDRAMGGGMAGMAADWKPACEAALALPPTDAAGARAFFQTWFRPVRVQNNGDDLGLFTGYYEPVLNGSLTPGPGFATPLYAVPKHHVTVDLGEFRDEWKGQRLVGRVEGSRFRPAETRQQIEAGALDGKAAPLVWVDDPVDAFFLHIQGSGLVTLPDGTTRRVGFAATNGQRYYAVGRTLIDKGEVPAEEMSMQAIRAWMDKNPGRAQALMEENPSYVFFRFLDGAAPLGSTGVPLTPGRSLAIDPKWIAYGIPIWLDLNANPKEPPGTRPTQLRRLMVTQDTGGAIRGIVRGDVYWGTGDEAGALAGAMKEYGRYYALLPRDFLARQSRAGK
jgi:membrane-bound lytic murein transglycosylase A